MSQPSSFGVPTSRRPHGFTFLEVLIILGIIALMIACVVGFFLSRTAEPLVAKPVRKAAATPAPLAIPAVENKPNP